MSHLSAYQRVKPGGRLLAKVLALGFVLVFFGCESEPPPKAAPAVVRKKIDSPAATKASEKRAAPATKATPSAAGQGSKQEAKPGAADAKTSPRPAADQTAAAKQAEQAKSVEPTEPDDKRPIELPALSPTTASLDLEQVAGRVGRKPPVVITDPFEPLFKEEAPEKERVAKARPERKRRIPQTPLEKIDLGQLKLTAIIRTPAGNKALVEESSGKGYIIQKGTWIGVHAGRVQEISDDAVVVEEEIENAIGEISLTKREMKLQKPPGE